MNAKKWLTIMLSTMILVMGIIGFEVYRVDPYFHYHLPLTQKYFYAMDAEKYMNDGIIRHFPYTAMITGTSMTENFKTSELDELFSVQSIKVPNSGANYNITNEIVRTALQNNPNLKLVVRGIDMGFFLSDNKEMFRIDEEEYPTYLYDNNIWNDYRYLFDRDVFFSRVGIMEIENLYKTKTPGILSFDEYTNWMWMNPTFGKEAIYKTEKALNVVGEPVYISEEERKSILEHIKKNVSNICEQYPDVQFYYFIPPYSAAWWQLLVEDGTIYKQLEAEKIVIEELLKYPNIHLFSFNTFTDITCDLDNYIDEIHYGEWINSEILKWMKNGQGYITKDNYLKYLETEKEIYTNYNYEGLLDS